MIFRTYPSLRYLLFLILGILFPFGNLAWVSFAFCICFALGFLSVKYTRFYFLRYLLPVSFFFIGIFVTQFTNQKNGENHISHKQDFEAYLTEVRSYTESKEKSYKVTSEVISVYKNGTWEKANGKVLLYFNKSAGVYPKYAEQFIVKNNLREIEAPKNPLEFNYKVYQARSNVFHHQFLRESDFTKFGENGYKGLMYYANLANEYTHHVFRQVVDDQNQLGVAEAMIGGMRSELNQETLDWYTKTGTVHALAVSGMHVAILFWVLNAFLGLFLDRKKLPFIFTVLILLWTYAVFTGLSPSVCRSTLMFSIFQIGTFIRRDGNSINTLLFSALILLIIVPNWIYDVGFQLSYLAVLGILVFYPWFKDLVKVENKYVKWIWEVTAVSVAAQVYTLPLTLYYFHQFPNYSLLANPIVSLICIPLLPVGLLVLLVFKVPLLGAVMGWIFKWLIIIMNYCVYLVFKLPFSVSEGLSLSVTAVILMFLGIGIFQYYIKSKRIYYLQMFLGVVIAFFSLGAYKKLSQQKHNEITFHYIPDGLGVSFVKGRSATFASTDSLLNEPKIKQYHLRNYYDALGVNKVDNREVSENINELISGRFGIVLWIKERTYSLNETADYILVSNNALSVNDISADMSLVLDGTNQKWYIDRVKEKNAQAVILYETGSKTYKL